DHVVNGRTVLPGVVYPEFARRAASCVGLPAGEVHDLHWLRPLEVNGSPVEVTVHFRQDSGGHAFELRSGSGAGELLHARGILLPPPVRTDTAGRVFLQAVSAACPRSVPMADYYRTLRALGLAHGLSLACVEEIRVGDGELLARL